MNKEEEIIQLLNDSLKPIAYPLTPKEILKEFKSAISKKDLYFSDFIYGMYIFENFELIQKYRASNLTNNQDIIILRHKLNNNYIKISKNYDDLEVLKEKDIKIVNPKTIEKIVYE
jgi:hypothetical protein